MINVSNSFSSYLPILDWCYHDPEHHEQPASLPASRLSLSQQIILIAHNETVTTVFIYNEATKEVLVSCGYQREVQGVLLKVKQNRIYIPPQYQFHIIP